MQTERRTHPRRILKRVGTIACATDEERLNCIVHDASEAGALIEVRVTDSIPSTFALTAPSVGEDVPCRVVRRTKHMLGVSFAP